MPMDRADEVHQWKITKFMVIGALIAAIIGGGFSLYGTIITLNQQQKALDEQKLVEQQNIAHALYIEVSSIEEEFNSSISILPSDVRNRLEEPDYVWSTNLQYHNTNSLYNVFSKDISNFNATTSQDLYEFYSLVIDIENKRETVYGITEKYLHNVTLTSDDVIQAHSYTRALIITEIPYCIKLAEKIKRELRQKYDIKNVSLAIVTLYPKTLNLGNKFQITAV
jgi:hypothetical protein